MHSNLASHTDNSKPHSQHSPYVVPSLTSSRVACSSLCMGQKAPLMLHRIPGKRECTKNPHEKPLPHLEARQAAERVLAYSLLPSSHKVRPSLRTEHTERTDETTFEFFTLLLSGSSVTPHFSINWLKQSFTGKWLSGYQFFQTVFKSLKAVLYSCASVYIKVTQSCL